MSKHTFLDPNDNQVYNEYSFVYNFKDRVWCINIWATSPEEAKERINALYYAKYDGQVIESGTVPDGAMGSLKLAWVRLKYFLKGLFE